MIKNTDNLDDNAVHICDSVVGQTDAAGLERLKRAAEKFENISVEHISEATYIKHINCHSQRDAKSPVLGIPAGEHVLPADRTAYMISWLGDRPDELADFWEEVEKI